MTDNNSHAHEEVADAKQKVRIDSDRYKYTADKDHRTSSGRHSIDNGDPVAQALRGLTLAEVLEVLKDNEGTPNPAWERLNVGMHRMSAGNALRRIHRALQTKGLELKLPAPRPPTEKVVKVAVEKPEKVAKVAKVKATKDTAESAANAD